MRTRWLARIQAALGRPERAAELRVRMLGGHARATALDAALERGEDGLAELERVRRVRELAGEVARIEVRHGIREGVAPPNVRQEYRYEITGADMSIKSRS